MSTSDPGVPDSPEEAQHLLYYRLGRATARCQIAEAAARSAQAIFLGREGPTKQTLGQRVRSIEPELPSELMVEYQRLVNARNYLTHDLLFDHGGWTGVPGLDSPSLYAALYASIDDAVAVIDEVTERLNLYTVTTRQDVMILRVATASVDRLTADGYQAVWGDSGVD